MNGTELQEWLNTHGASLKVDGKPGALTRAAIRTAFTKTSAPAVAADDIAALAILLDCSEAQIRAVAAVESGGGGFDDRGRPKILFERHVFHRLTDGRFSPASYSQAGRGGYNESSWEKLTQAACRDADAAFASCSWGKFQVMGGHWKALLYPSSIEMAYSTVTGEAAHYEMLARFIEQMGLKGPLRALSSDPEDNRAFARRYNGLAYEQNAYHVKLAEALR